MNCDSCEIFRLYAVNAAWEVIDANISKTIESKWWMPGLYTITTDIVILCFCTAIIFCIEVTVFIHYLGKRKVHTVTNICIYKQLYIASHVLPKIKNSFSIWSNKYFLYSEAFLLVNFLTLLQNQCICRSIKHGNWLIKQRSLCWIINFSIINFRETYRTIRNFPAFISR